MNYSRTSAGNISAKNQKLKEKLRLRPGYIVSVCIPQCFLCNIYIFIFSIAQSCNKSIKGEYNFIHENVSLQ